MFQFFTKALFFATTFLIFSVVQAQNNHAQTQCAACHGNNGISRNSDWPNLAGQKKEYLVKQLRAFKNNERQDAYMNQYAQTLKSEQIDSLATYYSSLTMSVQTTPVSLIPEAASCVACHGPNGVGISDMFPNLRGQKYSYLVSQLQKYKNGKRLDPTMNALASQLSEDDIKKIAKFYSELPLE